jgi:hypothetical protein
MTIVTRVFVSFPLVAIRNKYQQKEVVLIYQSTILIVCHFFYRTIFIPLSPLAFSFVVYEVCLYPFLTILMPPSELAFLFVVYVVSLSPWGCCFKVIN